MVVAAVPGSVRQNWCWVRRIRTCAESTSRTAAATAASKALIASSPCSVPSARRRRTTANARPSASRQDRAAASLLKSTSTRTAASSHHARRTVNAPGARRWARRQRPMAPCHQPPPPDLRHDPYRTRRRSAQSSTSYVHDGDLVTRPLQVQAHAILIHQNAAADDRPSAQQWPDEPLDFPKLRWLTCLTSHEYQFCGCVPQHRLPHGIGHSRIIASGMRPREGMQHHDDQGRYAQQGASFARPKLLPMPFHGRPSAAAHFPLAPHTRNTCARSKKA